MTSIRESLPMASDAFLELNKDLLGLPDAPANRREIHKNKPYEGPMPLSAYPKKNGVASPIITVITFPSLPDRRLHPNHRKSNFWAQRAKAAANARNEAIFAAGPLAGVGGKAIQRCEIEEVFTVPTRRRMDVEGLMAASKSWIDGITDAGVIQDDSWGVVTKLSGRIVYSKGIERTEIRITEVKHD